MRPIDLILKSLEGNIEPDEQQLLESWLRNPAHSALFEDIKQNWQSRPTPTPRAEQAYENLARRLGLSDTPLYREIDLPERAFETQPSRTRFTRSVLQWAAVFVGVLVLAAGGYFFLFREPDLTYQTGYAEIRTFLLPDSTVVTLNANSTLTLSGNWEERENRHVSLDGEAFFEVKEQLRQADMPPTATETNGGFKKFIVSTGNLQVEVIGTAFNVNSRRRETKVTLNSGAIRLKLRENDREILMKPGDFVEVAPENEPIIKKGVDVASFSTWKEGQIHLQGSTIPELQALLHDNYGIRIEFEAPETLSEVRLRGTFPAENPDLLLKAIADVTQTQQVTEDNRTYYKQKDKPK